jgi:hypothetical protein
MMGFFSNFFSKREQHPSAAQPQPAARADGPTAELSVYNQLVTAIVFSDTLRRETLARVTRAFEAPRSFYDENARYVLAERGLYYPQSAALTAKLVFIDTLMEHQQMAEVDWKEDEAEIRACIRMIMQAKQFLISIAAEEQYSDEYTHEVIELIDEDELMPAGYSLQMLDINSDSYVFTIVPLTQAETVAALFAKLK